MKYIFFLLIVLFFTSCASKEAVTLEKKKEVKKQEKAQEQELKSKKEKKKNIEISDLVKIPQNVEFFAKELSSKVKMYEIQQKYENYYFSVWNDKKPREKLEDVKWPFTSYKVGSSYGENLKPLEQKFFDEMYEKANFEKKFIRDEALASIESKTLIFINKKNI